MMDSKIFIFLGIIFGIFILFLILVLILSSSKSNNETELQHQFLEVPKSSFEGNIINSFDTTELNSCLSQCDSNEKCQQVEWDNQICTLKATVETPEYQEYYNTYIKDTSELFYYLPQINLIPKSEDNITSIKETTVTNCAKICTQESECAGFVFKDYYCDLKRNVSELIPSEDVVTFIKR